jgi:hypothetical protein
LKEEVKLEQVPQLLLQGVILSSSLVSVLSRCCSSALLIFFFLILLLPVSLSSTGTCFVTAEDRLVHLVRVSSGEKVRFLLCVLFLGFVSPLSFALSIVSGVVALARQSPSCAVRSWLR